MLEFYFKMTVGLGVLNLLLNEGIKVYNLPPMSSAHLFSSSTSGFCLILMFVRRLCWKLSAGNWIFFKE